MRTTLDETDSVRFLSGLWRGTTLGSPLGLEVVNRDAKLEKLDDVDRPRPGHADLAGAIKHLGGVRAVLERASARETAARVAAGALACQLLSQFGIEVAGWVSSLGGIELGPRQGTLAELRAIRDSSEIYSLHPEADGEVTDLIDRVGNFKEVVLSDVDSRCQLRRHLTQLCADDVVLFHNTHTRTHAHTHKRINQPAYT